MGVEQRRPAVFTSYDVVAIPLLCLFPVSTSSICLLVLRAFPFLRFYRSVCQNPIILFVGFAYIACQSFLSAVCGYN